MQEFEGEDQRNKKIYNIHGLLWIVSTVRDKSKVAVGFALEKFHKVRNITAGVSAHLTILTRSECRRVRDMAPSLE